MKILVSGIYYDGGGLSNVIKYLVHHLKEHFEIECLLFVSDDFDRNRNISFSCPIHYGCLSRNSFRISQNSNLFNRLSKNHFSHVILLGPISLNQSFVLQLKSMNINTKLIAFIPKEGKVINSFDFDVLNLLDRGVFYSKSSFEGFQRINESENLINGFEQRFSYVNHGLDKNKFYPISFNNNGKLIARKKIVEHAILPDNAFIVLNSNKPFYRKGLESTIKGFELFSKGKLDCFLHLHFGYISQGWLKSFKSSIDQIKNSNIILTYSTDNQLVYSDKWMNYLYNSCDVGLTTSYGEGWGLGLFEHAATFAPVIVPNHTVFSEHWKDIAILTEIKESKYLISENAEIYITDERSVCDSLELLYQSKEKRVEIAKQCFDHVTSEKYNWQKTADYFKNIIIKTSEEHTSKYC